MKSKTIGRLIILLTLFAVVTSTSCTKELSREGSGDNSVQNISLHFKPIVDKSDLQFGDLYTNSSGEAFSVRTFKFYISQIDLINDSSQVTYQVDRNSYFLVDFSDTATTTLILKSIPNTYNRIAFVIGVDSLHNVSGAQTGALDPANGMFWTWNSGYIIAKLEGNASVSQQPDQVFEYHIGGFKGDENVVRKVYLTLPSGSSIDTKNGKKSYITVSADVYKWFTGVNEISIAHIPVCMTPGPLSKSIADNYSHMFTVDEIVNQ